MKNIIYIYIHSLFFVLAYYSCMSPPRLKISFYFAPGNVNRTNLI